MPRLPEVDGEYELNPDLIDEYLEGYEQKEQQVATQQAIFKDLKRELNEYRSSFTRDRRLRTPPIERAIKFARQHSARECRDELLAMFLTFKSKGVFDQGDLFPTTIEDLGGIEEAA